MARTRHISKRMSQRGIRQVLIDLTLQFGEGNDDRCVLGRQALNALLGELRELQRTTMRAIDKGGIVVVQADGALITTYDVDSYDRRLGHGR